MCDSKGVLDTKPSWVLFLSLSSDIGPPATVIVWGKAEQGFGWVVSDLAASRGLGPARLLLSATNQSVHYQLGHLHLGPSNPPIQPQSTNFLSSLLRQHHETAEKVAYRASMPRERIQSTRRQINRCPKCLARR